MLYLERDALSRSREGTWFVKGYGSRKIQKIRFFRADEKWRLVVSGNRVAGISLRKFFVKIIFMKILLHFKFFYIFTCMFRRIRLDEKFLPKLLTKTLYENEMKYHNLHHFFLNFIVWRSMIKINLGLIPAYAVKSHIKKSCAALALIKDKCKKLFEKGYNNPQ